MAVGLLGLPPMLEERDNRWAQELTSPVLTLGLSEAMGECGISWHTHDPGVVLTHLGVAIADGADCLADFAALGEATELFGPVASLPTAWRAIEAGHLDGTGRYRYSRGQGPGPRLGRSG